MSDAEEVWRRKSDEELHRAAGALHDYTKEGRKVILAELSRRSGFTVGVDDEEPEAVGADDIDDSQQLDGGVGDEESEVDDVDGDEESEVDDVGDVPSQVTVVDVDMPFWSMVVFMVKWAVASIPALIILILLGALAITVFGGVLGGLLSLGK